MNSYSVLDIAISFCRYSELYELSNYKNICDRIEIEINKVLNPSRQRVLRGYYLMNSINKSIDSKSDKMLAESDNNSIVTGKIKSLYDDIFNIVIEIRDGIENSYKTYIDINKESDAQILSRFRNEPKVYDLIYVRNVLTKTIESTSVPINLTQKNMDKTKKSLAYSLIFGDQNRTLNDEEVSTIMEKIIEDLEKAGMELRK